MAVGFPAAIGQVEFDRAADRVPAVNANGGIGKIRAGSAVPGAELNDLNLLADDGSEMAAEITGEPARLELQFARSSQGGKEDALVDTRGIAKLGVTRSELHLGDL